MAHEQMTLLVLEISISIFLVPDFADRCQFGNKINYLSDPTWITSRTNDDNIQFDIVQDVINSCSISLHILEIETIVNYHENRAVF